MKLLRLILGLIYPILIILLLLLNLKSCNPTPPESAPEVENEDAVRQAEQTGNSGALKVTLLWDFEGDIDLHVKQPNGREIYFGNLSDPSSGGMMDTDNKDGGQGSAENIYWENPPKGRYEVYLHYYQESQATFVAGSGVCTVVIFQEGREPATYKVRMTRVEDLFNVSTINIE